MNFLVAANVPRGTYSDLSIEIPYEPAFHMTLQDFHHFQELKLARQSKTDKKYHVPPIFKFFIVD